MKAYTSRLFNGIPVGLWIRGSICHTWIYRVRRGNGFYDTKLGEMIQDKYPYFVPRSIKNPEGQPARDRFKAAVAAWQVLTDEDKAWWNTEVKRLDLCMSGYNLFISRYEKEEEEMFVDRGDPAVPDFTANDFIKDEAWHDLDLSPIVPAGAKAVLLQTWQEAYSPGYDVQFRKNGNVNAMNICGGGIRWTDDLHARICVVALDINRVIEYLAGDVPFVRIDVVVRGWWT